MSEATPADDWAFAGRYRVEGPIGSGGMGTVYSGYDTQLERRVAIKLMHQLAPASAGATGSEIKELDEAVANDRERFLREIRTTAGLEHQGIPAVYDFGVDPDSGRIFLVMQLLFGLTLADLISSRDYTTDPWPISWAAAIGAQIASTLADVHRVDVVHRDIKPSNLMVTTSGLVKILDFGVAVLQGASALPRLTQVGRTVGSPPYMSREQVLGNPVGPKSDVYALGCVLHEMITGEGPFKQTPSRSFQDQHVTTPAPSVRQHRPEVPEALADLILAMLSKQPAQRPDAETVYDTLLPFITADGPVPNLGGDPKRPFVRPMSPAPVRPRAASVQRTAPQPLDVDEALVLHERVAELVGEGHLQQAITMLEDAVDRARANPPLALELKIELASTLYTADEFSRAARVLDDIMPAVAGRDEEPLLNYYAGISHAEIGKLDAAIGYLRFYLAEADADDPLYRDAKYKLGIILAAVGQTQAGLAELGNLRPILAAAYGEESIHVRTLDRRIANIRAGGEPPH